MLPIGGRGPMVKAVQDYLPTRHWITSRGIVEKFAASRFPHALAPTARRRGETMLCRAFGYCAPKSLFK